MNSEKVKLLFIRDNNVNTVLFKKALKTSEVSAELCIAKDIETGTAQLRTNYFDCIFLDFVLPGLEGVSIIKRLQRESGASIAVVTSQGDNQIVTKALRAGAIDYIPNDSINSANIEKIIRNIVTLRNAKKEINTIEDTFLQTEKKYRIFFEKSQGFFCTHDLKGYLTSVNYAGAQSIGYHPKELIGINLKSLLSNSNQKLFENYLEQIFLHKKTSGIMKVISKSGEERVWSYNNSLYDQENKPYIIGSAQDITDQIKIKEERIKLEKITKESDEIKRMSNKVLSYAKKLRDSITYAKRLQKGLYKGRVDFKELFPNSFVINYPKEIVSGDFYWYEKINNSIILVTADCTGHGVPGALLSTLGYTMLSNISSNNVIQSASHLLTKLSSEWRKTFDFSFNVDKTFDGMDIAASLIDIKNKTIELCSMGMSIYVVRKSKLKEYAGSYAGINNGIFKTTNDAGNLLPTSVKMAFEKGDRLFMFSDGFPDQFGGHNGLYKFTKKKFKKLIKRTNVFDIEKQKKIIEDTFNEWKGSHIQIDDVLVVGVEL